MPVHALKRHLQPSCVNRSGSGTPRNVRDYQTPRSDNVSRMHTCTLLVWLQSEHVMTQAHMLSRCVHNCAVASSTVTCLDRSMTSVALSALRAPSAALHHARGCMFGDVTAFARAVATLPNKRMQRSATQRLCVEANELNKWCVALLLIDE